MEGRSQKSGVVNLESGILNPEWRNSQEPEARRQESEVRSRKSEAVNLESGIVVPAGRGFLTLAFCFLPSSF